MPAPAKKTGPLTGAEVKTLESLLARAGMANLRATGPVAKLGSKYQALTNLSVPRANDPDHRTDLVTTGNTVTLTDDEAAHFLGTCGDAEHRNRQRYPLIRLAAEQIAPMPRVTGREVSGVIHAPPAQPPPGYDGPRPDPAGSSTIQVMQEVKNAAPELTDPQAGSEDSGLPPDALDLPAGTRVSGGISHADLGG